MTNTVNMLSDGVLREIEARAETPLFEDPSIRLTVTERDSLCATVRTLRAEHEWLREAANSMTAENAALREQLVQYATLLNDGAETEDRCRDLLAAYDKSSPEGVIPLDEVVQVALTRLAQVEQEKEK